MNRITSCLMSWAKWLCLFCSRPFDSFTVVWADPFTRFHCNSGLLFSEGLLTVGDSVKLDTGHEAYRKPT